MKNLNLLTELSVCELGGEGGTMATLFFVIFWLPLVELSFERGLRVALFDGESIAIVCFNWYITMYWMIWEWKKKNEFGSAMEFLNWSVLVQLVVYYVRRICWYSVYM